jgi:uncharacterized membrane protein YhhN
VPLAIGLVCVGGLSALYASRRNTRWLYALAKGVAAGGFVWVALASGLPRNPSSGLLVVGLVLAAAGDVALAFRQTEAFLVGMGAFAVTHICYALAFVFRGIAAPAVLLSGVLVTGVAIAAWRWIRSHLPRHMAVPIALYMVLGGLMVTLAWGSFGAGSPVRVALGASAFYLSDLAVARERFVSRSPNDKLWGLPLYYLGQTLIALSV